MSRIASSRLALRLLPRTSAASFSSVSPAAAAAAAAAAASFSSKEAAAAAALPPKEAAAAASASASSSAAGDPSPVPPPGAGKPFGLLKAGILTAVTAALGATGYVTYGAISDPYIPPQDLTVVLLIVALLLTSPRINTGSFWSGPFCLQLILLKTWIR